MTLFAPQQAEKQGQPTTKLSQRPLRDILPLSSNV